MGILNKSNNNQHELANRYKSIASVWNYYKEMLHLWNYNNVMNIKMIYLKN